MTRVYIVSNVSFQKVTLPICEMHPENNLGQKHCKIASVSFLINSLSDTPRQCNRRYNNISSTHCLPAGAGKTSFSGTAGIVSGTGSTAAGWVSGTGLTSAGRVSGTGSTFAGWVSGTACSSGAASTSAGRVSGTAGTSAGRVSGTASTSSADYMKTKLFIVGTLR